MGDSSLRQRCKRFSPRSATGSGAQLHCGVARLLSFCPEEKSTISHVKAEHVFCVHSLNILLTSWVLLKDISTKNTNDSQKPS